MGVGNLTNLRDVSDIRPKESSGGAPGHKGGRRTKTGMKESALSDARSKNVAHKKSFRAGQQDSRDTNGPKSPSSLQVKTRRRGNGPANFNPAALG